MTSLTARPVGGVCATMYVSIRYERWSGPGTVWRGSHCGVIVAQVVSCCVCWFGTAAGAGVRRSVGRIALVGRIGVGSRDGGRVERDLGVLAARGRAPSACPRATDAVETSPARLSAERAGVERRHEREDADVQHHHRDQRARSGRSLPRERRRAITTVASAERRTVLKRSTPSAWAAGSPGS